MNWQCYMLLLVAVTSICKSRSDEEDRRPMENTDYYSQVYLLQQLISGEINKEMKQKQFQKDLARVLMDSGEELQPVPRKKSYLWFKSKPSGIPIQTRVAIGQPLQPLRDEATKPKGLFRYGRK